MFRNRKSRFYTLMLCAVGMLCLFLCAALQHGQWDVLRRAVAARGGSWPAEALARPLTAAGLLCAPLAWVYGTAFSRRGVRRGLILGLLLAAAGCVGLAAAGLEVSGGLYWLFALSLALMRCAALWVQMGVFALCMSWAVRFRGRLMGLVSIGGPLFYAIGGGAVAELIRGPLGGDHRPLYMLVALALALLAPAVRFLLRDRPEDAGLYPDGAGRPPEGEPAEEPPLGMMGVLRQGKSWLLLLVFGLYLAVMAGCLATLDGRILSRAGSAAPAAGGWLALGAILAIPASYFFGWLWDGSPARACSLLGLGGSLLPLALALLPQGGSPVCYALAGLGAAFLGGGITTLLPCALARLLGRGQYLAVSRTLLPPLALIAAAAPPAAARLAARPLLLYGALAAAAALGALLSLPLCRNKK